jgi:hypothetical protein
MSSPLENPVIRYGYPLGTAAIIVFIALVFLDGTIRWVALGIAVLEIVVAPLILKRVAENSAEVA